MAMRELGRFPSIPLRDIWPIEHRDFTPWLARNLDLLGKALDLNLTLRNTEVRFQGQHQPDIIADESGIGPVVVVENQLDDSDDGHFNRLVPYAQATQAGHMIWVAPTFGLKHRDALARLNEERDDVKVYRGVRVRVVRINSWLRGVTFSEVEPHHNGYFVKKVHLFVDTGEWRLNDEVVSALGQDRAVSSELASLGWEWDGAYSQGEGQMALREWSDPAGMLQRLSRIEADKMTVLARILPNLEMEFRRIKSLVRQQESELTRLIREWRFRDCCCDWCCNNCSNRTHKCRDCYCKMCVVFGPPRD